jgi:hypothetical protein
MKTELFPLDVAVGAAFCNRQHERLMLKNNIEKNTHTIIYAPRRYGKTSLVLKTCDEIGRTQSNIACIDLDLMWVTSLDDILQVLLKEIAQVLSCIIPKYEQALSLLKDIARHIEASVSISNSGVRLDLKANQATPDTIIEALTTLDSVARQQDYKVVLFLDEFQQISEIPEQRSVEAAFRAAAQKSTHTTYLFSGSNRHLLSLMFEDSARPLYHMCDQLVLERIADENYHEHIGNAAKMHWQQSLGPKVIDKILSLTRNHPYYTNALCRTLFLQDLPPDEDRVLAAWEHYVQREKKRFYVEFGSLSNVQQKLLRGLCLYPTSQPSSSDFLRDARVKGGSLNKALERLYALDMIYKRKDGMLEPIDPVILSAIKQKQR